MAKSPMWMLPSFWIDGIGILEKFSAKDKSGLLMQFPAITNYVVGLTLILGTGIGLSLIVLAAILMVMAWQRKDLVREMFRKLFNGYHQ